MDRHGPSQSELDAMTPYDRAVHYQTQAADPSRDIFVSANAGSGKTHVLVARVSRILLSSSDIKPEHILCLTYTKAAATEMQTRLFDTLGKWSVMPEAELRAALQQLYNRKDISVDLSEARQLFAKALETPEGLKVQTIHAFCERILARFPIEAGILPGFEPLDDMDAQDLYADIWDGLVSKAHAAPDSELANALAALMGSTADGTIADLRAWMANHTQNILGWVEAGGLAPLREILGVEDGLTRDELFAQSWAAVDKPALKAASLALMDCGKPKQEAIGQACLAVLNDYDEHGDAVRAFDGYRLALSKADGSFPTSQIGNAKFPPAITTFFGKYNKVETQHMAHLVEVNATLCALEAIELTAPVLTLAREFAADYAREKTKRRVLDFTDQIHLVERLLNNTTVSQWVRYKLDMGIRHILVDEAQDTAPKQWAIIDALSDAFAHDPKDGSPARTLFAVGDEKQSIYSFQGAKPQIFIEKSASLTRDYDSAQAVRFRMSFRSAPAILRAVDAVFVDDRAVQAMFDPSVTLPASDLLTHTAQRDIPGLVEVWPLSPPPAKGVEEKPFDPRPLNAVDSDSAREKLAHQIAVTVRGWIDDQTPISVKVKQADGKRVEVVRPMQAGDILILVRQRSGPFFNAVIRNLKRQGVAVAGADRLVLSESLAVQDLMSVARFACLPEDDLALAEILKGPLFDISETQLFDLAHGREGRLWTALRGTDTPWARAATARLLDILKLARHRAPYEFFADVLNMPTVGGHSQLRAMYGRLSMEAEDPVQAFLARALAHQRQNAPSLQHFVQRFAADTQTLKREQESAGDQLRVMTVYGAKGLEAPVVILPDTSQIPSSKNALDRGMLDLGNGTYARPPSPKPAALEPFIEAQKAAQMQEYLRLLYVAMTRAESRLLICGYHSGNIGKDGIPKAAPGSWHERVYNAVNALDGTRAAVSPFDNEAQGGIAYGALPVSSDAVSADTKALSATALPEWITQPRKAETVAPVLSPSHLLGAGQTEPPMRSPLDQPVSRFRRGNLIHKLLEVLPELATDAREDAADRYLGAQMDLDADKKADIKTTVMAVINDPRFAQIFAPGSRAEVSLAGRTSGLPDALYLNAQIDRLSVTNTHVFIIDYKSNRPPPTQVENVSEGYIMQMAAYRALAQGIYPDKTVVCGLLWTDGPDLMILPDARLERVSAQLTRAHITGS